MAHPEHPHGHEPEHHHQHEEHEHPAGLVARIAALVRPHRHDAAASIDSALEADQRGIRALKISLVALGVTAVLQLILVVITGSVALLFIAGSALFAAYESIDRLFDPSEVRFVWVVALAGVIGFVGNELVARYRMRVGREIGSAALVADGLHARADGFTSLGVVAGAVGVALGFPAADPIAGLIIAALIVTVLWSAGRGRSPITNGPLRRFPDRLPRQPRYAHVPPFARAPVRDGPCALGRLRGSGRR